MPRRATKRMAFFHPQVRRSLLIILGYALLGFPAPVQAGVLVTNGSQYVEISGIYYYNFYQSKNLPYRHILQASSTETLATSVSDQSFDSYAQLVGAAAAAQTVTPSGADASSLILNSHAAGTSLALAADYAQSYTYGRDYLLFTLDAPRAFTLTIDLSADSSRQGPGNSQASSEAYLHLVGGTGYVDYQYVESDDGGAPGISSTTLNGVLDAGPYELWNYSFASGYGITGSSSSQDATGIVTLLFPSDPGTATPEPSGFILLSVGTAGLALGLCWKRYARAPRPR